MTVPGTLIAVEGIDGSGKRTQVHHLKQALEARGHSVFSIAFPQYGSWFGKMVGHFLNGDLGPLESVDSHFSALLYAGDRFEARPQLEAALHAGRIVLADRYIASNLAHQVARTPRENRSEFIAWIEHLEYAIYGLPRESIVIYLRVPPREAQTLINRKSPRSYTTAKQDLQEASLHHLENAAEMYDLFSSRPTWKTIPCFDEAAHNMRPPDKIAADILAAVEPVIPAKFARKDP